MRKLLCTLVLLPFLATSQTESTNFEKKTISIGLISANLDESLTFYTEIVGMQEVGGFDIDVDFGKISGLTGGEPFTVKILKVIDDPDATELKLMSFGKSKNPDEKFIQDRNGMRYMTIFVKSLDDIIERINKNKIPLLGETPTKLGDGRGFVLIQDPDGVFVELIGNAE